MKSKLHSLSSSPHSWSKKIVKVKNTYSIVFSWDLWKLIEEGPSGKRMIVGGPAVKANPSWIPSWMEIGKDRPFLHLHNSSATRTSYGCIRKCPFCIVPKTEGKIRELSNFEVKPIVIDNNLLACSKKHFDKVIDKLKKLEWCDFNQGLDAKLLTNHHAERLSELRNPTIRLALDHSSYESGFLKALEKLRRAKIPKKNIHVYVLIGYKDTPEDALYRLRLIKLLGLLPLPMRYQPINTKKRNEYVGPHWTHKELVRFMCYWFNLRITGSIPFEEFERKKSGG